MLDAAASAAVAGSAAAATSWATAVNTRTE